MEEDLDDRQIGSINKTRIKDEGKRTEWERRRKG